MSTVAATIPGRPVRNGLTWKPYRYQGTGADILTPFLDDDDEQPEGPGRSPCGTYGAARRHFRLGEPLDDACKEANRRHSAKGRERARQKRGAAA